MPSLLLFSPGIDSFLALKALEKQGTPPDILVYYALNSRYTRAEIDHFQKLKMLQVRVDTTMNLQDIEKDDAYMPNRNLLMAMHAAGKYDADTIYVGGTASDRVSDNNVKVMNALSETLTLSLEKPVMVTSPFWNKYKMELAQEFVKDNPNGAKVLEGTFSCYAPRETEDGEWKECQRCKACFRKSTILYGVGISRAFRTPHIIRNYKDDFTNKPDEEQTPRIKAALEYIEWLDHRPA